MARTLGGSGHSKDCTDGLHLLLPAGNWARELLLPEAGGFIVLKLKGAFRERTPPIFFKRF